MEQYALCCSELGQFESFGSCVLLFSWLSKLADSSLFFKLHFFFKLVGGCVCVGVCVRLTCGWLAEFRFNLIRLLVLLLLFFSCLFCWCGFCCDFFLKVKSCGINPVPRLLNYLVNFSLSKCVDPPCAYRVFPCYFK